MFYLSDSTIKGEIFFCHEVIVRSLSIFKEFAASILNPNPGGVVDSRTETSPGRDNMDFDSGIDDDTMTLNIMI